MAFGAEAGSLRPVVADQTGDASSGRSVRDIRGDLRDRVNMVQQQINAEQAQFEMLIAQLEREQNNRLEDLRAQLRAVNRVLKIVTWQHNLRMAVARALVLTATVEISATTAAHQFAQAQN